MADWLPIIEGRSGPRYRAIADALQSDIAEGRIASGARLPTHRDLAWRLGVTVGTVTRAYVEAERRGLISGEVGRGTFVRPLTPDYPQRQTSDRLTRANGARAAGNEPQLIDLAGNSPPPSPLVQRIGAALAAVATDPDIEEYLRYRPSSGMAAHREAGAEWIGTFGHKVRPDNVLPTHGAQHATLLAASSCLRAGDVLLAESLTYFGLKSVARLMGLRLHGVEMDGEGVLPDALDSAIRATGARAFYTLPTLQNPTNGILSPERRQAVVGLCRRHGVTIIEDDIYGFLPDQPMPTLASLAPEQTLYITNLSKAVAPALRVGFLSGPVALLEAAHTAMRASSIMASPFLQEAAARLIADGTAKENALLIREEVRARQVIAQRFLGGYDVACHPTSMHVWLTLPEPWRREAFTAEATRRNVAVAAADVFSTGRQAMPHAVRISLSAAPTRGQLETGLAILADLLASEAHAPFPLV